MRFLADEICDFAVVRALSSEGDDVLAASEFQQQSVTEGCAGGHARPSRGSHLRDNRWMALESLETERYAAKTSCRSDAESRA
jgi:hypothetical protein